MATVAQQVKVGPEQSVKIRKDLDVVQGNMAVFAEMLGEMKPGQENQQDLELMEVSSAFISFLFSLSVKMHEIGRASCRERV